MQFTVSFDLSGAAAAKEQQNPGESTPPHAFHGALQGGPGASLAFPARQVQLLEGLARILDSHPELDLTGCNARIGRRPMGIDRLGTLWLDVEEGEADWSEFLVGLDVEFVRQRRKYTKVSGWAAAKVGLRGMGPVDRAAATDVV